MQTVNGAQLLNTTSLSLSSSFLAAASAPTYVIVIQPCNPDPGRLFRVCFEVGGGGKITFPCLKLVRIMLETKHFVLKYTHMCTFRKDTF